MTTEQNEGEGASEAAVVPVGETEPRTSARDNTLELFNKFKALSPAKKVLTILGTLALAQLSFSLASSCILARSVHGGGVKVGLERSVSEPEHHEIKFTGGSFVPKYEFDSSETYQMFQNFYGNAIVATKGRVTNFDILGFCVEADKCEPYGCISASEMDLLNRKYSRTEDFVCH